MAAALPRRRHRIARRHRRFVYRVDEVERISYPLGGGWAITHRNLVLRRHLVRLK